MNQYQLSLCALFTSLMATAAPIGSVSGDGIEISGVRPPARGVTSWPLLVNDDLRVHTGTALVTLRDGSKLLLAPGTRVILSGSGKAAGIRLLTGQAYFQLSARSAVTVAGLSHAPVPAEAREGVLAIQQDRATLTLPPGFSAAQAAATARNYTATVSPVRITPGNLNLAGFVLGQEIAPGSPQPQLPPPAPGGVSPVSPSRPADGNLNINIP